MSLEPNTGTAVKINNEADLDGSSDNSLLPLPEPPREDKKLRPLKIQLRDSTPHLQEIHQFQRPHPIETVPLSQPPSQMESAKSLKKGQKEMGESSPSPSRLNKKIKKGYEMASFAKVLEFKDSMSYRHKTPEGDFEPIGVCDSNNDLKQYGLGIYLYFQFLKRLSMALLLMSVVVIMPMIVTFPGTALSNYTSSDSVTGIQARLTIGNLSNANRTDYLILTISDILSVLILFCFWLHWRSFHNSIVEEMEKDHTIVNPARYVVMIQNFHDQKTNMKTLEMELRAYIDAIYKGAFEVQVVYNYNGNFQRFLQYDAKIEEAEKQHQIIKQTNKNTEQLIKLEKDIQKLEGQLLHLSQAFEPLYAYVHFRTLKAKVAFLSHCKKFRLQKTMGQGFIRSLCCTPSPPERLLFLGKFPLMLNGEKVSRPQEINWKNIDMSGVAGVVRKLSSLLLVVVAILICSAMIGICTLYVASSSNCQNYVTPTGATVSAQVTEVMSRNSESDKFCFCNANLASIYTEATIGSYCGNVSNTVLITNSLQIGASLVSAITNFILAIIISLIAKYLLRPKSVPNQYSFIFWGVLVSNFINAAIIPLLLNGSIFGVQFYSYLSFINFINFNQLSIFSDFTSDWYALISPYYINFIIIGCFISPLGSLIAFSFKHCFKLWRIESNCENNDKDNPLIQKEANNKVLGLEFEYAYETAIVILLLLIGVLYSGLVPLMIPLLTLGMIWTYICKRTLVVKYSIKVPADQSLNSTVINTIPIILLLHCLFSVWSHTTPGLFATDSPPLTINIAPFSHQADRVFGDVIILASLLFILVAVIIDFTLISFFRWMGDCCCKDNYEVPVEWAAIQNQSFSDRIQKSNILGSYKLTNHPTYGHALKAYKELTFRKKDLEDSNQPLNPQMFA